MSKMFMSAREISLAIPCQYHKVLKDAQLGGLNAFVQGGTYLVPIAEAEEYIRLAQVNTSPEYVLSLEARIAELEGRAA